MYQVQQYMKHLIVNKTQILHEPIHLVQSKPAEKAFKGFKL